MALNAGVVFNNPFGTRSERRAVVDKIIEMIDRSEASATVRLSFFTGPEKSVFTAIKRAYARGVHIRVVCDPTLSLTGYRSQLATLLGTDPALSSCFIRTVGRSTTTVGNGKMQLNMFLSSGVGAGAPVAMIGSSQISNYDTRHRWTDLLIVRRGDVYDFLQEAHDELAAGQTLPLAWRDERFAREGRDRYRISLYPRLDSGDNVLEALNGVRAARGVHIYVSMHRWSGSRGARIAEKLAVMKTQGVEVHVNEGPYVSQSIHDRLVAGKIDWFQARYEDGGTWVGTRYLAVTSPVENENFIITGTQDWDDGDLLERETVTVRKWGANVARLYAQHHMSLRAERRPELIVIDPVIGDPDPEPVPPPAPAPEPPAPVTPPPLPPPDVPDEPDPIPDPIPTPTSNSAGVVVVATQNIQHGISDARARLDVLEVIAQGVDVVGYQEIGTAGRTTVVNNALPNGWVLYSPAGAAGSTPIAFNQNKFRLLSKGAWLLTPRTYIGYEGAGASPWLKSKYIVWVYLRDRASGLSFFVGNQHAVSSVEGANGNFTTKAALQDRVDVFHDHMVEMKKFVRAKKEKAPIILTGDFNFNYRNDRERRHPKAPFASMDDVGVWASWRSLGMPAGGTHERQTGEQMGSRLIDYTAHTRRLFRPLEHKIYRGLYSDHHAVILKARLLPGW